MRQGIACAGNWILDLVHDIPRWPAESDLVTITAQRQGLGGGAANVAGGLVAMGAPYPVLPVGLIGAGIMGDLVLELCAEARLPVDRLHRTAAAVTSQTHVMNVPGGNRTFFYHPGANDLLAAPHIGVPELAAAGVRIFYLGYINLLAALDRLDANGRPRAADVLADARARGMITCADLVSTQGPDYRRIVAGVLPEIDVLFLNEIEAARATDLPVAGPDDEHGMTAAAQALKEGGVHRAVIVHSAALTVWLDGDSAESFRPDPLPPERIASAVGAGDAFAAGIMHGIHEGWPRARCVALGFRAATACLGEQTATDGLRSLGKILARP